MGYGSSSSSAPPPLPPLPNGVVKFNNGSHANYGGFLHPANASRWIGGGGGRGTGKKKAIARRIANKKAASVNPNPSANPSSCGGVPSSSSSSSLQNLQMVPVGNSTAFVANRNPNPNSKLNPNHKPKLNPNPNASDGGAWQMPWRRQNHLKRKKTLMRRKIQQRRQQKLLDEAANAPHTPYNTTSFIMRAKQRGGIAPAVTPSPITPLVLPTPSLSPGIHYKGSALDMNKDLGVDGYGSMNGLIRLRDYDDRTSNNNCMEEDESDVDQCHLFVAEDQSSVHSAERVEQRINQGLSRFEMIYPSGPPGVSSPRVLESRLEGLERLLAELEEENLTLKERLFLVEQEVSDIRARLLQLEPRPVVAQGGDIRIVGGRVGAGGEQDESCTVLSQNS